MSVDTEGSELRIIEPHDFDRFRPLVMTVEHNYDAARLAKLKTLLQSKGYRHVLPRFSQFDAWFIDRTMSFGVHS